jgi:hypothetical protein
MAKKTDPETTTPEPVAPLAAFSIPQIDIREMDVTIIGDSPLICHAWSRKAKEHGAAGMVWRGSVGQGSARPGTAGMAR